MSSDQPSPSSGGPYYYQPPRRSRVGIVLLWLALLVSLGFNFLMCCGIGILGIGDPQGTLPVKEKELFGSSSASDKVAVVRLEGVILEGSLNFVHKQIENAASDNSVKAVVLRVESPGGTITASDDLLRRLIELRDGTTAKFKGKSNPKPIVVSMGSVAASGGYYVAMAAAKDPTAEGQKKLFAERSSITGSIGVYASLPNAKDMADKIGFKMEMIKAGDIKGSGSPFHEMTPPERQPWQDMVDTSYRQFIEVVETGRPELKGKLNENLFPPRPVAKFDDRGNQIAADGGTYTRKRADGGIFLAKEAVEYGLIDAIGTLDDAANEAASQAKLADFRVIEYTKPLNLWTALSGMQATAPATQADILSRIDLGPRVWYLIPSAEAGARIIGH